MAWRSILDPHQRKLVLVKPGSLLGVDGDADPLSVSRGPGGSSDSISSIALIAELIKPCHDRHDLVAINDHEAVIIDFAV